MKQQKVYALGFFDGVHLGHQALLSACRKLASEIGAEPRALTFDIHPQNLIQQNAPALVNTPADRRRLLEYYGMAGIYTLQFDAHTRAMPWQAFFRFLTEDLSAAGLVCGADFRFGHRGEGTAQLLYAACRQAGIPCIVVPEQTKNGIRISSSHIRTLLEQGNLTDARSFLGHPHILSGTVISGRKLGRTIGVPTANLQLPESVIRLPQGVYACRVCMDGRTYPAVTNIGCRPTVGGHHVTAEPWILDFEGDLYGKQITVAFYAFLRPEKKFASLLDLKAQIQKDALQTRRFLQN